MDRFETPIITETDIDEAATNDYINSEFSLDLLPKLPEKLTVLDAASVLSVSVPTIDRMVKDGQLKLTKSAILSYLKANFLVNRPINLTQISPD